jgi:hypothetical protein
LDVKKKTQELSHFFLEALQRDNTAIIPEKFVLNDEVVKP